MMLDRLGPNDWQRFRAIRLASLHDAPEAFSATYRDWSVADESRWRARLSDVPFTVVAASGGHDVGTVSATKPDMAGCVTLISMWVAPRARGTGVSGALVQAVLDWARECGAASVELDVREDNAFAIKLYERHGFIDRGRTHDEPPERRMTIESP